MIILFFGFTFFSCNRKAEFKITAWEGYTPSHILDEFAALIKKKYDVSLTFNITLPKNEEQMFNQLLTGDVHVMAISHYLFKDPEYKYFEKDFLLPLNLKKIPAYKNLFEPFKGLNFEKNENKIYGVPLAHAAYRLIYNSTLVAEAPNSWKVLFDPKNDGHYTVSTYYWETNAYITNLVLGLHKDKLNKFDNYPSYFQEKLNELAQGSDGFWQAVEKPKEIKGKKFASAYGNFIHELVKQGEVWKFANPIEGEPAYLDYYVISKLTAKDELIEKISYEWINFSLSRNYQMKVVVDGLGEMPVTENIRDLLNSFQIDRFHLNNPKHIGKRSFFWKPRSFKTLDNQKNSWIKALKASGNEAFIP